MRIVHISDLHFGAVDPVLPDRLRAAIIEAAPDLVAISGDLTMRGRSSQFKEATVFLDSIPLPQIVVPGNHDVQGTWNLWERFGTPFQNYRKFISDNLEPVWRQPGLIVISANSARSAGWNFDWSRGRLSHRQIDRIARLCEETDADALRVLVVHHPPAAPPGGTARHLLGRLAEFSAAVSLAGIDLVLCGHFHISYAQALLLPGGSTPRSCVLSCVSTATSHRLKGEPNGFHIIDGTASELTIEDRAWNGKEYLEKREWKFQSPKDGSRNWQFIQ